jgi:hypothetical protein
MDDNVFNWVNKQKNAKNLLRLGTVKVFISASIFFAALTKTKYFKVAVDTETNKVRNNA